MTYSIVHPKYVIYALSPMVLDCPDLTLMKDEQ